MKPFHFKQFSLMQSKNVFRIGTDGVLLGSLAKVEGMRKILEVGTGTGLISLMLAQRNPEATILALDINEEAVKLASENFKNSPFDQKLQVQLEDYKNFVCEERFDLIISNPPYFEKNDSSKDILARQQTELSFDQLIQKSAELLTENGQLSVIIPFEAGLSFEKMAEKYHLFNSRKIKIFGKENALPKRWILEFSRNKAHSIEEEFTLEKSPRMYSEEYLEMTKDFHLFSK